LQVRDIRSSLMLEFEWDDAKALANLIGMCDALLIHITYTQRAERIRLISARRAKKHEQDHYYCENSY
jgi:uncharacterized DUF497 family protein